jgi:hypothetical protein
LVSEIGAPLGNFQSPVVSQPGEQNNPAGVEEIMTTSQFMHREGASL